MVVRPWGLTVPDTAADVALEVDGALGVTAGGLVGGGGVIGDVPDATGTRSEVVDTDTEAVAPEVGLMTPLTTMLTT